MIYYKFVDSLMFQTLASMAPAFFRFPGGNNLVSCTLFDSQKLMFITPHRKDPRSDPAGNGMLRLVLWSRDQAVWAIGDTSTQSAYFRFWVNLTGGAY